MREQLNTALEKVDLQFLRNHMPDVEWKFLGYTKIIKGKDGTSKSLLLSIDKR